MLEQVRVEWGEQRAYPDGTSELFLMLGMRVDGVWIFFERSTFESRWYKSSGTVEHMVAAENTLARTTCPCLKKRRRFRTLWASLPPTRRRTAAQGGEDED